MSLFFYTNVYIFNYFLFVVDLLRNVIELRDSDWGRASTSPVNSHENIHQHPPPTSMTPQVAQMGVYYGPDGQALTAEETEFLDQGMRRHEDEDEYEYICLFYLK